MDITRFALIWEISQKSATGGPFSLKSLPDVCKFHLAALQQFPFALQPGPTYIPLRFNDK